MTKTDDIHEELKKQAGPVVSKALDDLYLKSIALADDTQGKRSDDELVIRLQIFADHYAEARLSAAPSENMGNELKSMVAYVETREERIKREAALDVLYWLTDTLAAMDVKDRVVEKLLPLVVEKQSKLLDELQPNNIEGEHGDSA